MKTITNRFESKEAIQLVQQFWRKVKLHCKSECVYML